VPSCSSSAGLRMMACVMGQMKPRGTDDTGSSSTAGGTNSGGGQGPGVDTRDDSGLGPPP
jgi:hypothetical protein